MVKKSPKLTQYLSNAHPFWFCTFAILSAFATYSCMYAFRKPFAAATFDGQSFWGVDYKILLITAQVIGYTFSKFLGIKVVSESKGQNRMLQLLSLIGVAALSLLFFGLVVPPYNIIFLFLNGLPLGMVWGLVFAYLEGRKFTEILGAGLSVSFIFSSGFVKSIGRWVMIDWGVSEMWMPLVVGLLFSIPLLVAAYLLDHLPPPTAEDEALRTKRSPMNGTQRWAFFREFAPGLVCLILIYALLTSFRDFRDNFMAEIWTALGYGDDAVLFTLTEIPIAFTVLVMMALMMLIKSNIKALLLVQVCIVLGLLVAGIATFAFEQNLISAPVWITLNGFGLYLGYVPFNSVLFDRLIAAFRYVSTAGFAIYLADAFGYLSSIGVMFYKNFGQADLSWLQFFIMGNYFIAISGIVLGTIGLAYFYQKYQKRKMKVEALPKIGTLKTSE